MSYSRIRLDLAKTDFPFLTTLKGRTVEAATSEEYYQAEDNKVGVLFCENVVPIKEGLHSIKYTRVVAPLNVSDGSYLTLLPYRYNDNTLNVDAYEALANYTLAPPYSQYGISFKRVLEIRVSNAEVAYVGVTAVGQLFLLRKDTQIWKQITNEGYNIDFNNDTTSIDGITVATLLVNNTTQTYICLPNYGIFLINLTIPKLTKVTFRTGSSIDQSKVVGICSAYNYLILHDGNQLQWSSAFDPLDFNITKAQETGTGFGVPIGLQGKIIAVLSNPEGFKVYSENNIINAAWSSNILFPWVFTPIANSAGIRSPRDAVVGQENVSYVVTTQGLQQVTHNNAQHIFPELTDFLQYRTIETYNYAQNLIEVQNTDIDYGIFYIGNRYFLFSYKVAGSSIFTHAFLYDSSLKRWGKLVIAHVDAFVYRLTDYAYPKASLAFLKSDGEIVAMGIELDICPNTLDILGQPQFYISGCLTNFWTTYQGHVAVDGGISHNIWVRTETGAINLRALLTNAGVGVITTVTIVLFADANVDIQCDLHVEWGLGNNYTSLNTIAVNSGIGEYQVTITLPSPITVSELSFMDVICNYITATPNSTLLILSRMYLDI